MKRKLKWIGVFLVVLLLGFGTALFLLPRDRITAESWKNIQLGMTEKEVETILGEPGLTDEGVNQYLATLRKNGQDNVIDDNVFEERALGAANHGRSRTTWIGRHGFIEIFFDQEGHAVLKLYQGWRLFRTDPSFIERLRDWLGW